MGHAISSERYSFIVKELSVISDDRDYERYARSMLPRVWSSFSKVIVAAFGILLSGSSVTLKSAVSTVMLLTFSRHREE